MRNRKGTLLKDGKKRCVTCSQEKTADCFAKDKKRLDSLCHTCKECIFDKRLRREHGITSGDYYKTFEQQSGKCATCGAARDERMVVKMNSDNGLYLICHACSMRDFGPKNRKGTAAKDGVKTCSKCQEEKSVDKFSKDRTRGDGYRSLCKECYRIQHLKSSYGMTPSDYEKMVEEQDDRCDCCRLTKEECNHPINKPWYVDHCHKTGKVRALVCSPCNTLIGYAEILKDIVTVFDYLKRHNTEPASQTSNTLSV